MLKPKKTKFRKHQKGILKRTRKSILFINTLKEGVLRLDSQQSARITSKQIESCRQSISRRIKRLGKLQIKSFPDWAVSKKPTEVRMGKGKGAVEFWGAKVKPGTTLFEISGANNTISRKALESTIPKLPVKVKIVG
jgi:large subunit ribosomal protein L16